eukprot:m.226792 g.226792  ORF g.226792 m.226792 type:complete len:756 (-) comp26406_c0_seq1:246-2513(-)
MQHTTIKHNTHAHTTHTLLFLSFSVSLSSPMRWRIDAVIFLGVVCTLCVLFWTQNLSPSGLRWPPRPTRPPVQSNLAMLIKRMDAQLLEEEPAEHEVRVPDSLQEIAAVKPELREPIQSKKMLKTPQHENLFRAKHLAHNNNHGQRDLFIAVLTDPITLRTLGMAAYTTWARDMEPYAAVYFVVGSCSSTTEGFPGNLICLDTPDTYPPQRKVFLLLKYMHTHFLKSYRWFMKCDADAYVNVPMVRKMLSFLRLGAYRYRRSYLGLPATGRVEEREKLGLDGKAYCSGLGYLLHSLTLEVIGEHLGDCLADVRSNHSDTEVGRCIFKHAGSECQAIPRFPFKQVYYQQIGNQVFPMKLIAGGQMHLAFPTEPKETHFSAVIVHPLKQAEDFYRFHKQTMSSLRPVQQQISMDSAQAPYRQAVLDLRTTCVNNRRRQIEASHFALRECHSPLPQSTPVSPSQAFILIPEHMSIHSEPWRELQGVLKDHDITDLVPVKVSEWDSVDNSNPGYRLAMQKIFKNATFAGTKRLLVFEYKIFLHCNFKAELWNLLNNFRCGAHLFTEAKGGVLLLGADVPDSTGLQEIEQDRSQAFLATRHNLHAAMCYNVNSKTKGSFAAIYHRATFGEALAWLAKSLHQQEDEDHISYDGLFTALSDKGYIVRAAFPNLVLREPSPPIGNQDSRIDDEEDQQQEEQAEKEEEEEDKDADDDDGQRRHRQHKHIEEQNNPDVAVRLRWFDVEVCRRGGQAIPLVGKSHS